MEGKKKPFTLFKNNVLCQLHVQVKANKNDLSNREFIGSNRLYLTQRAEFSFQWKVRQLMLAAFYILFDNNQDDNFREVGEKENCYLLSSPVFFVFFKCSYFCAVCDLFVDGLSLSHGGQESGEVM